MANTDIHGSARWAEAADLQMENLLCFPDYDFKNQCDHHLNATQMRQNYIHTSEAHRCLLMGRLADPAKMLSNVRKDTNSFLTSMLKLFNAHENDIVGWAGDGHVITVAPTRSGKGVGLVLPNLLHYPGSVIVIDPKGENYAVTAKFRRDHLKQTIICLDPFRQVQDKTDSINPLDGLVDYRRCSKNDYLKQNPELGDIATNIAEAIIIRESDKQDPHWDDKARTLLRGLILAVIYGEGPYRHLQAVREILTKSYEELIVFIKRSMCDSSITLLKHAGNEILSCGTNELRSVISSALKHTEFLESELVCDALGTWSSTGEGDYDINQLKTHGGVSIYIVIPPQHLNRYARLIRLWITMAMAAMTRTQKKPADGCPVLFMLDEMAQLGTLPMLRQAVSLLAGYGMSIWMVWQDLSQLKELYQRDWPTFLANAKIQQFFGINDHETAKYISEMLGKSTITSKSESEGKSGKFAEGKTYSTTISTSETSRNLLNPDEVRRLNREIVLTFVQGMPPILLRRISYFNEPMFSKYADTNPYY